MPGAKTATTVPASEAVTVHIGGRGRRGIDLYDVERAGLECEIAEDTHRAGRSYQTGSEEHTGSEDAARVDLGRCHGAVATQYSETAAAPHADRHPKKTPVDKAAVRDRERADGALLVTPDLDAAVDVCPYRARAGHRDVAPAEG